MVEQADLYVKNVFPVGDIRAIRKLADGRIDIDRTIVPGDEEKILLPEPGVLVVVSPPSGVGIEACTYNIVKGDDIITCSRDASTWTVQIMVPNNGIPETPTSVTIEISGPPPAP